MKICFVLTHVPDPRINKRIEVAKGDGNIQVICVRRKGQDIWEPVYKDIEHIIFNIDLPSSKQLLKRTLMSEKYKRNTMAQLEIIRPDIIYADGFDSLLIACHYKKRNKVQLVYEVADLREDFIEEPKNFIKKIIKNILSIMEKKSLKQLSLLVLTSMKFYDIHYHKLIDKKRVLYAPNVPEVNVFSTYNHKSNGDFTIGFIGGIRYLNQMKMLVDVTEKIGCKVIFAGAGGTSFDYSKIGQYCRGKSHVTFTGKYDYNREIAKLYGSIDCVYAVYDASNPNVRIALPNKLYESVYCELPIIVAKNTYLSEIVEQYGIGKSVGYNNEKELYDCIIELMNKNTYKIIKSNCINSKNKIINNNWKIKLKKFFKRMNCNE